MEQAKGRKPGERKEGETRAAMKVGGARGDPGAVEARRGPRELPGRQPTV